jgi:galactoside O-acetyltransferase
MHIGGQFYTEAELAEIPFRHLGRNVKIKKTAGLYFTENISIGDNTRIDDCTQIVASGEPVVFGRNVHVASLCYISGSHGFEMEDFTGLSPGVLIFTSSDDYLGDRMTNPTLPKDLIGGPAGKVTLHKHSLIGAGSVVLPNVDVGEAATVGALSLIKHSLDAWGVYAGNPLRRLKDRKRDFLVLHEQLLAEEGKPK